MITVSKGTDDKYRVLVKDLQKPEASLKAHLLEVIGNFDHEYSYHRQRGAHFLLQNRSRGAARARDRDRHSSLRKGASGKEESSRDSSPQAEETFDDVNLVGGRLIALYLERRQDAGEPLRPRRPAARRRAISRHRFSSRVWWPTQPHRDVLYVQQLRHAGRASFTTTCRPARAPFIVARRSLSIRTNMSGEASLL